jgi:DNA invertase Pin-like site-specific DNA recombinase
VRDYLDGGSWQLVGEFTEVESGKHAARPELAKALALCKRERAKLAIAKLDRLSRNVAFLATLMDRGVDFVACDNPHANKLTIHILAAVAQHEREMIAQRTKDVRHDLVRVMNVGSAAPGKESALTATADVMRSGHKR